MTDWPPWPAWQGVRDRLIGEGYRDNEVDAAMQGLASAAGTNAGFYGAGMVYPAMVTRLAAGGQAQNPKPRPLAATVASVAPVAETPPRSADYTRTGEKGRGADPWEHFARAGVEAAWFTWPEQQLLRTVYQVHTRREGWHKNDRRDRETRAGIALEPGKLSVHYARKFGRRYSRTAIRDAARNLTRWGFHVVVEEGGDFAAPVVASGWHRDTPEETTAALRECFARMRADRRKRPLPPGWIDPASVDASPEGRRAVTARSAHRRRTVTDSPPYRHRTVTGGGGGTPEITQAAPEQSVDSREMTPSAGSTYLLPPTAKHKNITANAGGERGERGGERDRGESDSHRQEESESESQLWEGIRRLARRRPQGDTQATGPTEEEA